LQRLTTALRWLLGGLVLATVLALFAPLGWPFELFSHFRVQYMALALVLAVLLAWRRAAVPAVLALLIGGWHALPWLAAPLGAVASQACACSAVTAATVNVPRSLRSNVVALPVADGHHAYLSWVASSTRAP